MMNLRHEPDERTCNLTSINATNLASSVLRLRLQDMIVRQDGQIIIQWRSIFMWPIVHSE